MNRLIIISLSLSLFGILLLPLLSHSLSPPLTPISEINQQHLNKQISIKGNIDFVRNLENFQILTIRDSTGTIIGIANSKTDLNLTDNVLIQGKIQEYEDELQININKITKI